MKTSTRRAALVLAMLPALATAGDDWTPDQQQSAVALMALHITHWGQQRARVHANSDDGIKTIPTNPGMATAASLSAPRAAAIQQPTDSLDKTDRQFLAGALVGTAILYALPSPYRDAALRAGIAINATIVANNLRLGIGINF